jgi:predicted PurR-regulated permease PerM
VRKREQAQAGGERHRFIILQPPDFASREALLRPCPSPPVASTAYTAAMESEPVTPPYRSPPALRVLMMVASGVAVWLASPFANALLVAAVVAVLAWPLHARLTRIPRLPRAFGTLITLLLVTVGAVVPVALLLWLVSRELAALATQLAAERDRESNQVWVTAARGVPAVAWLEAQAGGGGALAEAARTTSRDALLDAARNIGQDVPGLLGLTARAILNLIIFYVALATLFSRGEEFGAWVQRTSPLPPAQTTRLFSVFAEFARNVVLAGIIAAAAQGAVAGVGYWIAGVDRPVLFALLTGVLAFVPLVGTAAAWVPIALLLLLRGEVGAATFVAIWSLALTGTVDNFIKPFIVRGRSDMPTLLVFLGVFGGLIAFGLIGLLVGPVLMALLLALFKIHEEGRRAGGDGEGAHG